VQLASALHHLHHDGPVVLLRDFKPDNVITSAVGSMTRGVLKGAAVWRKGDSGRFPEAIRSEDGAVQRATLPRQGKWCVK
jgi:serine/threonine protein kinase